MGDAETGQCDVFAARPWRDSYPTVGVTWWYLAAMAGVTLVMAAQG
jgi:hypothetical protein